MTLLKSSWRGTNGTKSYLLPLASIIVLGVVVYFVWHHSRHSVAISWNPSSMPIRLIAGYNVYRDPTCTGNYGMPLNGRHLIGRTNYTDYAVEAGKRYCYAATTVDVFGAESFYSPPIAAVIPSP